MNNSGVNTILIVLILLVVVAGMVWFFKGSGESPAPETGSLDVNLELPTGDGGQE